MNSNHVDVTPESLKNFNDLPIEGKFQMINLLKFKKQVSDSDMTGIEKYAEYMKAVMPFFIKSEGQIVYDGKPQLSLIGPKEEWDKILIVEYPSKAHFVNMITTKGYPSAIRASALEDSRLILCQ
ncbi:DUF1330 domain-containing protein [Saprospiraceae bacterium]|nr:DUF1330 domain-containing protein [Saprospiraceae bacterium]